MGESYCSMQSSRFVFLVSSARPFICNSLFAKHLRTGTLSERNALMKQLYSAGKLIGFYGKIKSLKIITTNWLAQPIHLHDQTLMIKKIKGSKKNKMKQAFARGVFFNPLYL